MKRKAVTSEAIASVGHDARSRILEIEFRSGDVYDYFDVPPRVHEELLASESLGRYFQEKIRPVYRYRQVRSAA